MIGTGAAVAFDDLALVYTSTESGRGATPTAFMRCQVAKDYCSDPRTRGTLHGHEWATFWTSARNYFGRYNWQPHDLDGIRDDGRLADQYPRVPLGDALTVIEAEFGNATTVTPVSVVVPPMQDTLF